MRNKRLWELAPGTTFRPSGYSSILTKLNGGLQRGQLPIKQCGDGPMCDKILCMNAEFVVGVLDAETYVELAEYHPSL